MAAKTLVTGEFPTPSEIAAHLRIPAKRVAELRREIEIITSAKAKRRRAAGGRKRSAKKK